MGFFSKTKPQVKNPQWQLSDTLFYLSDHDRWTIGDAFQGTQIFGSTGSAKTTSSMAMILLAFLRAGFGGIFFTVKPTDTATYLRYCKMAGREQDVVLFGPDHPNARFNFIGSELERVDRGAGHVENLVSLFSTVLELIERNQSEGAAEKEVYWKRTNRQLLRNILELLMQATGRISIPDIYRLAVSAPNSAQQAQSAAWQEVSFCYACLKDADQRCTPERHDDLKLATDFFLIEWPNLSEKTRSIVLSTLTSMLDVMNRGITRQLLSPSVTTLRPEAACDGKLIIIDMPIHVFREVGLTTQIIWKYSFQKAMERRDVTANPRPVFMATDESHFLITPEDQLFQTTARSARVAVVNATQSISNYLEALGGAEAEAKVHSLLGNLQSVLFHQQTCIKTNQFAAELIGRTRQYFFNSSSSSKSVNWFDVLMGHTGDSGNSTGMSEQYEYEVQPSVFPSLRKGGPPHWSADVIVVQGGRRFQSTGGCWLPVTIKQQL